MMNKLLPIITLLILVQATVLGAIKPPSVQYLSPQEFQQQLTVPTKAVLVDIRTPEEYAAGHIKGAQLINLYDASFTERISQLDKHKMVLIYCRSGNRTEAGREVLQAKKFNNIGILKGGINAWLREELPVEQ